jgi:hypothetical protein
MSILFKRNFLVGTVAGRAGDPLAPRAMRRVRGDAASLRAL